jgi:hypothetical protein
MLPMAELVVAIGAVLGAVVLVVVNRSNRGSANVAGSKQ